MSWLKVLPETLKRPLRRLRGVPPEEPKGDAWFEPGQIDELRRVYYATTGAPGSAWDRYRHANMVLPAWFRQGLDPWGNDYAAQQQRLWKLIANVERDYAPEQDEKEEAGWKEADAIRAPGFYARRDAQAIPAAGDQVIAIGMLLKHCGLKAGDRALEYGAGFGQGALALARLGVEVDTVDISATFSAFVQRQGEHFGVPLTAFEGRFGVSPRPERRYDLIWFYESFHHCVDFIEVVPRLAAQLAEGGRIILAGEPVFEAEYAGIPYPWGVRLHSEVAAVMRRTRWFELGFTEPFIHELFDRSGLVGRRVDCDVSTFGRLYIFERRSSAAVDRGEATSTREVRPAATIEPSGPGGRLSRPPTVSREIEEAGDAGMGSRGPHIRKMEVTRVFVIGNSHTKALSDALASRGEMSGAKFEVRWLLGKNGEMPLQDACARIAELAPNDMLVMALLGGYHMRAGLLQHEQPFWVLSDDPDLPDDVPEGHQLIPHASIRSWFRAQSLEYKQLDRLLAPCRARRFHLMTPPPTPDNSFIARHIPKYQGHEVTAERVAPPELRRRLWALERQMLAMLLLEKGTTLVGPPPDALDVDGFVLSRFRGTDGVHANKAYGALVLQQLSDLAGLAAVGAPTASVTR